MTDDDLEHLCALVVRLRESHTEPIEPPIGSGYEKAYALNTRTFNKGISDTFGVEEDLCFPHVFGFTLGGRAEDLILKLMELRK